MDNLRVFSTFKSTSQSYSGKRVKRDKSQMPRDKNGMIVRDANEKPSISDSEIRAKLQEKVKEKQLKSSPSPQNNEPMAKKEGKPVGDVGTNDPNDTNTTEKLKSLLSSGAIQFSGKEQSVLQEILKNR